MTRFAKHGFIFLIGALLAGWAGSWLGTKLTFKDLATGLGPFWERFQVLFIVSALIERSVETYLNATDQNGQTQFDLATRTLVKTRDASQAALIAALVLSSLVAVSGVRIIGALVILDSNATGLQSAVWNGVDILVSAGLMAGGSDLFHQLAKVITTGLGRISDSFGSTTPNERIPRLTHHALPAGYHGYATPFPLPLETNLRLFTVVIERPSSPELEEGTLRFADGGISIVTRCWWGKGNRIDPGTYQRCSKTYMPASRSEAIYLPDAVSRRTGEKMVFIHGGGAALDPPECISVTPEDFRALWRHIESGNGQNIVVAIRDV